MKTLVIIPSRLSATRLPGKPLLKINGISIISHVFKKAEQANIGDVIVATEDQEIIDDVKKNGGQAVLTKKKHETGTDRIYEVLQKFDNSNIDLIMNLQGDEPLMDANNIRKVIKLAKENPKTIINGWTEITSSEEYYSRNIPKVAVKKNGTLMYMSRSPIPGSKNNEFCRAKKQVCVYSFPNEALSWLRNNPSKTNIEEIEDIEILRFIESDWPVQMTELDGCSIAVDTSEDLEKVRGIMKTKLDSFKETISLAGT